MDVASRASLDQEIYLRGLTGYLVGKNLFEGYKKLAIITYPDRICSSMASSVVSSFLSTGMYKDYSASVFLYDENKLEEIVKEIIKYDPDILFIAYGGEQKLSHVSEITKKTIEKLMKNNYKKALAIHVRTWLATKQLSDILSDNKLKEYLKSLPEIRLFTADAQNKKFFFNKVKIEDTVKLEKFKEENITNEHANLLKISIPPQ
jgi:organic radical activating enzyme